MKKIPRTRKSPLDYLSSSNTDSVFIAAVTPEEIKVIINSVKNRKAICPYSIPVYLPKILSKYIAAPLCDVINDSFSSGVFPDLRRYRKIFALLHGPEEDTFIDICLGVC